MAPTNTPVFGIDLGTTYSCIAYVDDYGRPVIVSNADGQHITPSVVQFTGSERVVGKAAKDSAVLFPNQTVELVKNFIGNPDRPFSFQYEGRSYTPEEISSYILGKVVQDAEQQTGMKISDVVITCPAYFGIPEREATANAGKIAGLNVLSILNEPTAAAITYGTNEEADQTAMVYDLGGGTFDITIIRIESGSITVVATGGNNELGGRNWDERIVTYFANEWMSQTSSSENPLDSPETMQELFSRAESAKITLTGKTSTDVPIIHEGQRVRVNLTREKFDELTSDLLDMTISLTNTLIGEAQKRGITKIDQLLMVGGSTLMPQVKQRLIQEYGDSHGLTPRVFDPSEAVAKGAAIYGYRLSIKKEIIIRIALELGIKAEDVDLPQVERTHPDVVNAVNQDAAAVFGLPVSEVQGVLKKRIGTVTSRSFGVIAVDEAQEREIVSNLIRVNDPLPVEIKQTFVTAVANQSSAQIQIVDNFSSDPIYEPSLSRILRDKDLPLPAGLPKRSPIEITFQLSEQGRLRMIARDLTSGREIEDERDIEGVMSKEEVEEAARRYKSISLS
jgi:molecular chaperone DnaK